MQDVLGAFAIIAGLAREGKVDKFGFPKHPLQRGATLRTLSRYGSYDANIPIPVQQILATVLGLLAEAMGYKAVDSRYMS